MRESKYVSRVSYKKSILASASHRWDSHIPINGKEPARWFTSSRRPNLPELCKSVLDFEFGSIEELVPGDVKGETSNSSEGEGSAERAGVAR